MVFGIGKLAEYEPFAFTGTAPKKTFAEKTYTSTKVPG